MAKSKKKTVMYKPPKIRHFIPPFHIHTSACGWTADRRNLEILEVITILRELYGVLPIHLTRSQFDELMNDGWCGNCLHNAFDIGDLIPGRQWIHEEMEAIEPEAVQEALFAEAHA